MGRSHFEEGTYGMWDDTLEGHEQRRAEMDKEWDFATSLTPTTPYNEDNPAPDEVAQDQYGEVGYQQMPTFSADDIENLNTGQYLHVLAAAPQRTHRPLQRLDSSIGVFPPASAAREYKRLGGIGPLEQIHTIPSALSVHGLDPRSVQQGFRTAQSALDEMRGTRIHLREQALGEDFDFDTSSLASATSPEVQDMGHMYGNLLSATKALTRPLQAARGAGMHLGDQQFRESMDALDHLMSFSGPQFYEAMSQEASVDFLREQER